MSPYCLQIISQFLLHIEAIDNAMKKGKRLSCLKRKLSIASDGYQIKRECEVETRNRIKI